MYTHFAKRLKERYGLDITPIEYIDLIQQDFKTISIEQGKGVSKVLIMFKDVEIIAIKQRNRNKFLVTALPKK
jgi:hypothetical protein